MPTCLHEFILNKDAFFDLTVDPRSSNDSLLNIKTEFSAVILPLCARNQMNLDCLAGL